MPLIQTRLEDAIRQRDFAGLRDAVEGLTPSDLADLIGELPAERQATVFRVLPRATAAATFEYLPHDKQEELLKSLAQEEVAAILNEMSPDDRTMLLEELPATVTRQLLSLLDEKERAVAIQLLGYPENSVGRFMTPEYIAVRPHWTVRQVLDYVRKHGQDKETLNLIYVVDDDGVLIDDVRIRRFLLADPEQRVSDLMDRNFTALKATDDRETAVNVFRQADLAALPVTDTEGALIGIVTSDDILDVAEDLATEDIQMLGGSEALDEPYMQIAFHRMVRKRAGWLVILFIGEMLTATAMSFFEKEIARAVALALFVPLIISLRAALAADRHHSRPVARRHCDVGSAGRFDAAAGLTATRLRSRRVFGAVGGDAGGRNGIGHIFQHCGDHPARRLAMSGAPGPLA